MTNYYELLAEQEQEQVNEKQVKEILQEQKQETTTTKKYHKHKASRGREYDRKTTQLPTRMGDKKEIQKGSWGDEQKAQLESVADEGYSWVHV